jgi:hypothetical protein
MGLFAFIQAGSVFASDDIWHESRQLLGDRKRIGGVLDRQLVNVQSIMVKDEIGH